MGWGQGRDWGPGWGLRGFRIISENTANVGRTLTNCEALCPVPWGAAETTVGGALGLAGKLIDMENLSTKVMGKKRDLLLTSIRLDRVLLPKPGRNHARHPLLSGEPGLGLQRRPTDLPAALLSPGLAHRLNQEENLLTPLPLEVGLGLSWLLPPKKLGAGHER